MSVCVCPDWKPVSVPGLKCKLCQRLRHGEVTREAGTHGQPTLVVATRTHNGKAQPLTAVRQTAYCTLRQAYPPPCRPTADYSSLHRRPFTGPQPITVPSTDRSFPAHSRLQFPPQTVLYRPTADYSSLHRPPLTGPSAWLQHKALPEAGNPAVWKRNP